MYKLVNNPNGPDLVKKIETNKDLLIPFIDGNRDYEQYKKWLTEGNEPLPADE
jgi:hypothetical protein